MWKIESMQVVFDPRSPMILTLLHEIFHMAILETSLYVACLFLLNEGMDFIYKTLRDSDTYPGRAKANRRTIKLTAAPRIHCKA